MRRLTRIATVLFLVVFLTAVGAIAFLTVTVAGMGEIPDINTPQTSTFYDRNAEVITTRFEQNRFEVPLETVPDYLEKAFIAVEDHRFYNHHGIDIQGLSRAVVRNISERRFAEGGSTITQQLAKNLFLTHDKTLARKAQELLLTLQLERRFSKDEILEKYLNTIYFGHSAYGVEAASRLYFGKSVGELTLSEAALLAGIPRGPAYYSPYLNEEAALRRRSVVLSRMAEEGYITQAEKDEANAQDLAVLQEQQRIDARAAQQTGAYFIDYLITRVITRELGEFFDDPQIVSRGGLQVYTTLDKGMQQAAEEIVANETLLPPSVTDPATGQAVPLQVGLVSLDPQDGSVRAMVGGRDFATSQINMAVRPRSPGSAFKPFTFAAALEAGLTPNTVRESEAVVFEDRGQEPYEPSEYGGRFYGPLAMREAIARSSNVVSIKLHDEIGRDKTVEMAQRLGIQTPLAPNLSLPLGTTEVTTLEMAAAFAPFANQGIGVKPRFITKITDSAGRVLYEDEPERTPVLDPRIAYQMTDLMKSVFAGPSGTGRGLPIGRPVAGKTGTSNDHRDSYMVGYTPDLVTSVWVGNVNNISMGWGQTGAVRAGSVWAAFMRRAHQGIEVRDFARPGGLVSLQICPHTGLLHNPRCSLDPIQELFIAGTEPTVQCSWPECPHCPPQAQWHWDGGWWFLPRRNNGQQQSPPPGQERERQEEQLPVEPPPTDEENLQWNQNDNGNAIDVDEPQELEDVI